ncbi:MAG: hypothetical protein HYX41_00720 [Bdellovibrio sp.]|nr:hypothetical protein [Bdellovibrio sp.]
MKKPSHSPFWFLGDRILIFVFAVFDVVLIYFAHQHFQTLKTLTSDPAFLKPAVAEKMNIEEMKKLAEQKSWDVLENVRASKAYSYLESNTRPSPNAALYFYPETLPDNSFEREFALKELQSALSDLKKHARAKELSRAELAYQQLESRIRNYEIGGASENIKISAEAVTYLAIYRHLIQ